MSIDCIVDLLNVIRLFQFLRHTLTLKKPSRMHVLCDDARMLGDDVFRVCFCFNPQGRNLESQLSQKISIQPALELHSIEHNNKITYTSFNDERLLKVYESKDLIKLPFKHLSTSQ